MDEFITSIDPHLEQVKPLIVDWSLWRSPAGNGLLSGSFPLSMLTQGGNLPSQADIRILYRPGQSTGGDGHVVATTTCNADGTWQVYNLNESLKFDIVARIPGFNDVIIPDVQPTGAPLTAHFAGIKEEFEYEEEVSIQAVALGGTPPYNYTVNTLPEGLTFDSGTGYITGSMPAGDLMISITVTDAMNDSVTITWEGTVERETTYDVFTASGNYLVPEGITEVDVLIVAGGGGGGSRQGGGGGAGGLQIITVPVTPLSSIPVVVGLGGQGGTSGGRGSNGGNSSFGTITSIGGGGGGGRTSNPTGNSGGSGGGGTLWAPAGSGVAGQGNAGGNAPSTQGNLGGGGGGASQPGSTSIPPNPVGDYQGNAGPGGDGIFIPDLIQYGDEGWFAGGGGGSGFNTKSPDGGGEGGRGGGGKGHGSGKDVPVSPPGAGESGLPNTGGGGGGSGSGDFPGGNGGSGVVIVVSPGGRIPPTLNSKRAITVSK